MPAYFFVGMVVLMIVVGVIRHFTGGLIVYDPTHLAGAVPVHQDSDGLVMGATLFVLLRAFANGGSSLTGVEAISNTVGAFRKPEGRNARKVLTIMACILGFMVGGVSFLVHRGAGAYICGEETALLESLEGKRGQPRSKPPFPAISGVYASPTLINNVESIATIPAVLAVGPDEYAKIGAPPDSTGTRLFCLSGNVSLPGVYEAPHGITVRHLIYDVGGGVPDGHTLKAVMMGGSSFPVMTPDDLDTPLDANSLGAKGYFIGSGVVTVIDERTCIVQFALRVAQFYMHESCGKCTPCRVGTRWLVQLLRAVEEGTARERDLELTLDVCDRIIGKCLCVLGDSAAMPVASCVTKFRDEFRAHVEQGGCPFGADSQLAGLFAPVDQHAHTSVAQEAAV